MKKNLLILISSTIILSCTNKKANNQNIEKTSKQKVSSFEVTDSSDIKINANFPFGCSTLKKYKYPKNWESEVGSDGILEQPQGKEFEEIEKCFQSVNLVKTINKPRVTEWKILKLGDDFKDSYSLNSVLQKSTENCKYRLPNIGVYECYYSFVQDTEKYGAYGNLLLIDAKTKAGKVLNIYFEGSGDSSTLYRYFLIEKSVINIYEGSCYDDGCSLDKKFTITINSKGEINISK